MTAASKDRSELRVPDASVPYDHMFFNGDASVLDTIFTEAVFRPGAIIRFRDSAFVASLMFSRDAAEDTPPGLVFSPDTSLHALQESGASKNPPIVYLGYSIHNFRPTLGHVISFKFLFGEHLIFQHRPLNCQNIENEFGTSEVLNTIQRFYLAIEDYFETLNPEFRIVLRP